MKINKKKKKRKPLLPKNYDPSVPPDPERWLPKYERSSYKAKGKRKQQLLKGPQGAAVAGGGLGGTGSANIHGRRWLFIVYHWSIYFFEWPHLFLTFFFHSREISKEISNIPSEDTASSTTAQPEQQQPPQQQQQQTPSKSKSDKNRKKKKKGGNKW